MGEERDRCPSHPPGGHLTVVVSMLPCPWWRTCHLQVLGEDREKKGEGSRRGKVSSYHSLLLQLSELLGTSHRWIMWLLPDRVTLARPHLSGPQFFPSERGLDEMTLQSSNGLGQSMGGSHAFGDVQRMLLLRSRPKGRRKKLNTKN